MIGVTGSDRGHRLRITPLWRSVSPCYDTSNMLNLIKAFTSVTPLRRESWYHHDLFYPLHTGSFYYEANCERIWHCTVASNLGMYNSNTKMVLFLTVMARIKSKEHEVLFGSVFLLAFNFKPLHHLFDI